MLPQLSVSGLFLSNSPLLNYSGREIYYNQGFMGFVSRITPDIPLRSLTNNIFSVLVLAVISAFSLMRKNYFLTFSLFVVSLVLLDSLSWQHHFVWLIFPFVLLSAYAAKLKSAAIGGLIGLAYLLVSWNFKNPSLYLSFPKILFLSNQFYGAAILWGINVYLLTKAKLTS